MKNKKPVYLTEQGLKNVQEEYEKLKKAKEEQLKKTAPEVLSSDDLNAEYIAFRENLDFLDARLLELGYVLKNYELIKKPPKAERNKVGLGAKVEVEIDGQKDEFLITGTLEANPSLGRISNESPVGLALMSHKAGDEIVINSPIRVVYKIKKIRY